MKLCTTMNDLLGSIPCLLIRCQLHLCAWAWKTWSCCMHLLIVLVGTVYGCGYDGQQKFTICDACRLCHLILKVGSQYNDKQCVVLHRLHVDACRNATRRQDRLGSYPCVPLCYILASGRQETPNFFSNKLCISQINATQGLASLCEPALSDWSQFLPNWRLICCA